MSLNVCTIMGRLTRDPELRRTGSGTAVANFTLAVDRDFAPKDGGERETDFIDCIAWRGTAEFVSKYFTKGSMAIVSGRLQIRNWTDKDGNKRRSAEVEASSVYFGESRKSSEGNSAYQDNDRPYAQTEALIAQYQAKYQAQGAQQSDYALLEDDEQLPFPF